MNLLPSPIFKLFFFSCLCLFSLQAKSLALTTEEQQWLAENPSIVLGSDYAWPPYDFVNEQGQHAGISADIIENIRQTTGLDIQIKSGVWSNIMDDMKAGRLDGLVCAIKTPAREAYLNFSPPYTTMPNVIVLNTNDDHRVQSMKDLTGKTIAINQGSYLHEWLQANYPDIPLHLTRSNAVALEAVSFGEADAYIGNLAVSSYIIRKKYLTNLKVVAKLNELETQSAIAIDKQQPILMSIIQKALSSIDASKLREINEKWVFQFQENQHQAVVLSPSEQAWIQSHGAVEVASELDWPPFNFVNDDKKPVGLSLDILRLVAQKTGLTLNITMNDWATNLENIEAQKVDLLPAAVRTQDRERFAAFSRPYFNASNYFFVRDDLEVTQFKDLDGKTVAIPKGFAGIQVIKTHYPNISVLETNSIQEAVEAVIQNRAQLLYGVYPVISYVLRETGVHTIMPFKATRHVVQDLTFMLRKDEPELLSIINKGLAALTAEEKAKIESRWLAISPKEEEVFELSALEKEWLNEYKRVSFSGDPDWLPFEAFTEEGRYTGIVADFLADIEALLPLRFEAVPVLSWQETLALAEQKKVDVISGDTEDAYLAQNYQPIEPYITTPIVIVMNDQADFVPSLSELDQHVITIVEDYGYTHALLEKYPEHRFKEAQTPLEALESVALNRTDAAVLSLPVASYLIKQYGFQNLKIVGKTGLEMNVTLFVTKEKPILHQLLNRAMKQVKEEKGGDILNAWIKLNFASRTDYWLIFQIMLIALFVISVIFYWNLRLAKEVKQRKEAERLLEVEKNNFKYLFEQATDGHLIYQRGRFIACNKAALKLLGLTNKEALLTVDLSCWSPEFQPDGQRSAEKRKALIKACYNEGMQRFDWVLQGVDKKPFWVDVVYTSIPYLGKPAIYISWRDKTEQKALEEKLKQNEEQMKLLIDSIPLIVIVTSFEGEILSANRKAIEDYQVTPEKMAKLNIADFYQNSSDRTEIRKILQKEGRVNQKIVTMKDVQGQAREMMLSVIPIKYNNQSALLTISVDLTERILAEKQLKEAMARAEAANQSKTEFLANMSHEIRTPMNAILGFTELLNEQVQEPRLKSFIGTIQSAGNTLLMLINDILDLSKIEAGKMTLNNIATNPHDLFKEVGDIFSMNIQKKGLDFYIEIDPELPHSLLLDPVRLRQVLFNLLGNAVKFTETGSIKLSVKPVNVFDHLSKVDLLIKIEDTGIGIPLDQQDRIFNVFEQQAGQDSGKFGGTGLGLSITKRLVAMMKGHISLESTPNKGSIFSILLEKVDIASVHSQHQLEASFAFNPQTIRFKPATILVVDDILNNRELICQNFKGSGIRVIEAENGQEAIEQYKEHNIDLVLMDIRMPVLNGYEAAKVIKVLNPNLPIVALTASVMQDEFEKIRREHFDDYLRKPVLRNDLMRTLSQFLPYRHAAPDELPSTSKPIEIEKESFSEPLRTLLTDELTPLYLLAIKSNGIEEIKLFAKKAAELASEYNNDALDQFASQLLEKVDSFDIAGMQFLLKKYEAIQEG